MEIWFVLVLIAASGIGSGLIYLATKNKGIKIEQYQNFANEQGWKFHHDKSPTNTGNVQFSDPDETWSLSVIFTQSGALDGMTKRRIEWHSPHGALDSGEAVLGMPIPAQSVAMLQSGGAIGQQILKTALKSTLHALGQSRFDLKIDESSAGDPGGIVMASQNQHQAMDALRKNQTLAQFRTTHKPATVPVIIRNETGLILRRPGSATDINDLSELVALGMSLRADI